MDLGWEFEHGSLRKLCVWLHGLPRDAAVWRPESEWTMRDELLALLVERVDTWGLNQFKQAGGKATGKPIKIPRPWEDKPKQIERKRSRGGVLLMAAMAADLKGGE